MDLTKNDITITKTFSVSAADARRTWILTVAADNYQTFRLNNREVHATTTLDVTAVPVRLTPGVNTVSVDVTNATQAGLPASRNPAGIAWSITEAQEPPIGETTSLSSVTPEWGGGFIANGAQAVAFPRPPAAASGAVTRPATRARVLSGPNAGLSVACVVSLPCSPPAYLSSTLPSPAILPLPAPTAAGIDVIELHTDTNGNGVKDTGEPVRTVRRAWHESNDYHALGDSYSAGDGIDSYATSGGRNYNGADYSSLSNLAYPNLTRTPVAVPPGFSSRLARLATIPIGSFQFYACTGAVTAEVLADEQELRGPPPLSPRPSQLSQVTAGVDLITFTIGGNDLGFSDILNFCASVPDCTTKTMPAPFNERPFVYFEQQRATVQARVEDVIRRVKQAVPGATVVVMGYPELFGTIDGSWSAANCPLTNRYLGDAFAAAATGSANLDATLRAATVRAGAWFVPVTTAFAAHGVCDTDKWIIGAENVLPERLFSSFGVKADGPYHPNARGARAYADLLNAFLRESSATAPATRARGCRPTPRQPPRRWPGHSVPTVRSLPPPSRPRRSTTWAPTRSWVRRPMHARPPPPDQRSTSVAPGGRLAALWRSPSMTSRSVPSPPPLTAPQPAASPCPPGPATGTWSI